MSVKSCLILLLSLSLSLLISSSHFSFFHTSWLVGYQFPNQVEPRTSAVKVQSPNHWTACLVFFFFFINCQKQDVKVPNYGCGYFWFFFQLHVFQDSDVCAVLCLAAHCVRLFATPPGSSVHGILQARILQWVVMPSSRGPSCPRDWT